MDILAADRTVDEALAATAEALSARDQLVRKPSATGIVFPGTLKALQRKRCATGAMLHVGLQRYADIHLVGPDARKKLEDLDRFLKQPRLVEAETQPSDGTRTDEENAA